MTDADSLRGVPLDTIALFQGAMQRYETASGIWRYVHTTENYYNLLDDHGLGYGVASTVYYDQTTADRNSAAIEHVFQRIRDSGKMGYVYCPAHPADQFYYVSQDIRPQCVVSMMGEKCTFVASKRGLYLDGHPSTIQATNGKVCHGSFFANFALKGWGSAIGSRKRAASTHYDVGWKLSATHIPRPRHGLIHQFECTTAGTTSADADPTDAWLTAKEADTITDGTVVWTARVAAGIWNKSSSVFAFIHTYGFYGDQEAHSGSFEPGMGFEDAGGADDTVTFKNFCNGSVGGDGVYTYGGDASTIVLIVPHSSDNAGYNFNESGFLGNLYLLPHAEFGALGNYNCGGDSRDLSGGSNNRSVFVLPYSESGSPPDRFINPAMAVCGVYGNGVTADTGFILDPNEIGYMPQIVASSAHYRLKLGMGGRNSLNVLSVSTYDQANAAVDYQSTVLRYKDHAWGDGWYALGWGEGTYLNSLAFSTLAAPEGPGHAGVNVLFWQGDRHFWGSPGHRNASYVRGGARIVGDALWGGAPGYLTERCIKAGSAGTEIWREYGSVGGYITKSVAGSANVTLAEDSVEYLTECIELTGALAGNISVILPTRAGKRWLWNHTTGAFTVTVKTAAGAGPTIAQGMAAWVCCNGVNILRMSQDVAP